MNHTKGIVRGLALAGAALLMLCLLRSAAVGQTLLQRADGGAVMDHAGRSVSGGSDVDLDGYLDVVVGIPDDDTGALNAGRAQVISGENGLMVREFWSTQAQAAFGSSVSLPGDLDGDGYGEILVGAPLYDVTGADCGRAYLYSGQTGNLIQHFSGS